MIFVDTGAWFAGTIPWDANHAAAAAWLSQNHERLFTIDFILDETLTLLRARHENPRALTLGAELLDGDLAELYHLTPDDLRQAWAVFRGFSDKAWSFTDCTSKVIMDRLGLTTAFSFDHHFR